MRVEHRPVGAGPIVHTWHNDQAPSLPPGPQYTQDECLSPLINSYAEPFKAVLS